MQEWAPTFEPFKVANKCRHVRGKYRGVCTSCPDGKITRGATKHVARMAGLPEDEWEDAIFDTLNIAGASNGFRDPDLLDSSIKQLRMLIGKHNLDTYIIIDHERCAAYLEELLASPYRDDERLFHQMRLQEAYLVVKSHFPDLKIILVYLSYEGDDLLFSEVPPPGFG